MARQRSQDDDDRDAPVRRRRPAVALADFLERLHAVGVAHITFGRHPQPDSTVPIDMAIIGFRSTGSGGN